MWGETSAGPRVRVSQYFVEEALVLREYFVRWLVSSLLTPGVTCLSLPAGTPRLSLPFWHFFKKNPALGTPHHREGRVEGDGSLLFSFLKNYFPSFAERKESSGSPTGLVSDPSSIVNQVRPGDRDQTT